MDLNSLKRPALVGLITFFLVLIIATREFTHAALVAALVVLTDWLLTLFKF